MSGRDIEILRDGPPHVSTGHATREHVVKRLMGDADGTSMVEGMLAEPWHLTGYQEKRLREFLELLQLNQGILVAQ